ncbi:MAG: PKD domain-containing protein [Bacteroidota bacterium]|nr:MAG: PKD domain-containing protein [Bacteroidota bacterium]
MRLVAYNPNGCVESDTAFTTIRVIEDVDASFITQKVLNCIDDTVHFTLNANPIPANVTYAWNFGDGTIGNSVNPTHIYTTQNTYTITCIATNGFAEIPFKLL